MASKKRQDLQGAPRSAKCALTCARAGMSDDGLPFTPPLLKRKWPASQAGQGMQEGRQRFALAGCRIGAALTIVVNRGLSLNRGADEALSDVQATGSCYRLISHASVRHWRTVSSARFRQTAEGFRPVLQYRVMPSRRTPGQSAMNDNRARIAVSLCAQARQPNSLRPAPAKDTIGNIEKTKPRC
jgi:hypothetical protein